MPTNPPFPIEPDQRQLAAIVFTDVAGFSRRMQKEEVSTMKLLERDFVSMRAFCAMHSGRVLKTTGDGLLLYFTSAVHAVQWALKTQRHFADQAAELPAREILRHRVGIHVGDVHFSGNDVMGDGVNIAARVQAESPAGGICISQMVYAVVKNKLELDVAPLGPRELKNINEPIPMYRVLLEPPVQRMPGSRPARTEAAAPVVKATAAWKKWTATATGLAALAAAAALLFYTHWAHQQDLAGSQRARDAFEAAMRAESHTPDTPPTPAASIASVTPPAAAAPAGNSPEFDFARLAMALPLKPAGTDEERRALEAANGTAAPLMAWTLSALARYTRENPLYVTPLHTGGLPGSTVFVDAGRELFFASGGAARKMNWSTLTPDVQGAIIISLLRSSTVAPPTETVRAAEAFAYIHRLPEMAEILLRERGSGTR